MIVDTCHFEHWVSPCGRAELYLGDNLEVLPTLKDKSIDAIITDPPYGFSADDSGRKNIGRYQASRSAGGQCEWKNLDCADWNDDLPLEWLDQAARIVRPGGAVLTWTDNLATHQVWDAYKAAKIGPKRLLYWCKTNPPTNPSKNYMSAVETAVFGRRPGKVLAWNGGAAVSNLICWPKCDGSIKIHPTQKPLKVMQWCIEPCTKPGHLILDPFAGSASTLVAAIGMGRRAIGIEQRRDYFEAAVERLSKECAQGRLFA